MSKKRRQKRQLKRYPRCWRTQKIAYPDESMAVKGIAAMWRHRPDVLISDMNTYKCYHCGKWHIGHKSKYREYLNKYKPVEMQ